MTLAADVGKRLAYGSYERGDLETALDRYVTVAELAPADIESHVWVGRILIETERPRQAMPFWRRAVDLDPTDARAAYFVELAREQATWGSAAVTVFRAGVALYEQDRPTEAAERFARASTLNEGYVDAWAWLGRVAFETARVRRRRDLLRHRGAARAGRREPRLLGGRVAPPRRAGRPGRRSDADPTHLGRPRCARPPSRVAARREAAPCATCSCSATN